MSSPSPLFNVIPCDSVHGAYFNIEKRERGFGYWPKSVFWNCRRMLIESVCFAQMCQHFCLWLTDWPSHFNIPTSTPHLEACVIITTKNLVQDKSFSFTFYSWFKWDSSLTWASRSYMWAKGRYDMWTSSSLTIIPHYEIGKEVVTKNHIT